MSGALTILAGRQALNLIRDGGLRPEDIKVLAGAAGGPKWLVLNGLDRALFGHWFKNRRQPLFFLGASIGAWRFAAACQKDPLAAIDRFEKIYINQRYTQAPTREEILRETIKVQTAFLAEPYLSEILVHPFYRLNFLAVRCRGLPAGENKVIQGLGLGLAALINTIDRRGLSAWFERVLFYDARDIPPFFNLSGFRIHQAPLSLDNISSALLASGSIPLVMYGVRDVPGGPPGMYRDAGILDYHLDLPFLKDKGLVLYPHFSERIIPGWLDKRLSHRRHQPDHFERVVLLCPSKEFRAGLPLAKIPDRQDFYIFKGRDDERIAYWTTVVKETRRLGDEFMEAVTSNKIKDLVQPLD